MVQNIFNQKDLTKPFLFGKNLRKIRSIFNMALKSESAIPEEKEIFGLSESDITNSLFYKIRNDKQCVLWHVDGSGLYDMLISSYPNPTEILIPLKETAKQFSTNNVFGCNGINDSPARTELKSLIDDGSFEIFTPKPGEIWYLPANTIHRVNPKAYGGPHLSLRVWNPIKKVK